MGERSYFLMDLERTLSSGVPCYWKAGKHGYTYQIEFAGIYNEAKANEIVKHDLDETTVKVPVKFALKLLGKDIKAHEGS